VNGRGSGWPARSDGSEGPPYTLGCELDNRGAKEDGGARSPLPAMWANPSRLTRGVQSGTRRPASSCGGLGREVLDEPVASRATCIVEALDVGVEVTARQDTEPLRLVRLVIGRNG
jgi:hypothetical protein